ncbi:MAG: hypothetical protein TEF_14990 [Rhizobiales bacterium NRL2]|jgi:hypothetical protein|nr:MAG: hypothetical protein TEF_14990 [Rhizobiales bacterium NRL2]
MLDATPLMKIYASWRIARLKRRSPREAQERELMKLLHWAKDTRFGKAHGFAKIRTVEDFQAAVPIASYEDYWRDWWRESFPVHDNITSPGRTPHFAVTSGTTSGKTKYIPVTREMIASNKKAAVDVVVHHLANHPDSRPLAGKTFMMGGSTDLVEQAPGIDSGDLSGIAVTTQSAWTKPFAYPPTDVALWEDWEKKLDRFARDAFEEKITIWTGTPSWMLILIDRMREIAAGRPLFPNLELLVHGGVSWELYRERFAPFLAETGAKTREVYPASEGFIAVADKAYEDGLRLIADNGIFFEFVPLEELDSDNPTRHWVGNLETGQDYAVVLSSNAGLYAYLVGDTVRFVDRDGPRLKITGRTSYMLSAFGEHLIGSEIETAVHDAAGDQGVQVAEFTVGPVLHAERGGRGGHIYLIETEGGSADADRLARRIDERLSEVNDDYAAHRVEGTGMEPPRVVLVGEGGFERWMASRGKSGGQHKVPRVIADADRFRAMLGDFGVDPESGEQQGQ